jgi:hypothetical protein
MEMIGKTFDRLIVLARGRSDSKHLWWVCRCSCGMDSEVRGDHLRLGFIRSCGCLHREIFLASGNHYPPGRRFGRLTVVKELGKTDKRRRYFCRCSCGNHVAVRGDHLAGGVTLSCGCWYVDSRRLANRRHGKSPADHESAVYSCYIRERGWCENPTDRYWKYYGGRSIRFCFSSFPEFYAAVGDRPGPRHWLMRKDRDGHFEPGNLAWVQRRKRARK